MASDDARKTGKSGAEPAASEGREPREGREAREPREPRLPLAEMLRRGLSAGRDVSESLFPRELASGLAAQLVDARHGLVNAIAVEVGRFLRQADIASEMRKVLAGLQVEAKIHLKFSEDPEGKLRSDVEIERTPSASSRSKSKPPPPTPEE